MAAINAVEGLVLSASSKARLIALSAGGLTHAEKRKQLLAEHRKLAG